MNDDQLIYFSKLIASGDYKRMAELLHLWRWSGVVKDELIELRNGLKDCLEEIEAQMEG